MKQPSRRVEIQETSYLAFHEGERVFFEVQSDELPTEPLLHKNSRFLYILSGKGKIRIQGELHELSPGRVVALLPWQISEIIEVSEPLNYYLLIYPFGYINYVVKNQLNIDNEKVDLSTQLYQYGSVMGKEEQTAHFKSIFEVIGQEVAASGLKAEGWSSLMLMVKIVELAILYVRVGKEEASVGQCEDDADGFKELTPQLFQYIYLNLSRKVTLKELSKRYFVSEASISRYIFKITGLGFYDLIHEMKLSKVKFLLLHSNLTIEEIAKILNYSDISHLSRVFSEQQGIGARQYRANFQKSPEIATIRQDEKTAAVVEYIYRHFTNDITIAEVANAFGTTPKQVNDVLAFMVEMTFRNFLNYLRTHEAANLLLRTDYSVTDIAFKVGYNSLRSFNRNFLRWLKLTPQDFRERVTEQHDPIGATPNLNKERNHHEI